MERSRNFSHWIFLLGLITSLLAGTFLLPAQAQTPTATPAAVNPPADTQIWSQPVNLSRSGAASQPRLVGAKDGRLQAFWLDRFDGLTSALYDGSEWGDGFQTLRPAGQFSLTPSKITVMPTMVIDANDVIHGFWYGEKELKTNEPPLLYSQAALGAPLWKLGINAAESALAFTALPTDNNEMQLAYIRTLKTTSTPPGIFSRRAISGPTTGGVLVWQNPTEITSSIYYRVLTPEEAVLQSAAVGSAVFILWREPRLDQVLFAASTDSGITWTEPEPVQAASSRIEQPLLATLPAGDLLRIWQDSAQGACTLYQQVLDVQPIEASSASLTATPRAVVRPVNATPVPTVTLGSWSEASQILPGLETCPAASRFFSLDEKLYWLWGEDTGSLSISVWDGGRGEWSQPNSISFNFEDHETGQPVSLSNLHAWMNGDRLAVLGSDLNSGEIWATISSLSALEVSFAPASAWNKPKTPSKVDQTASQPVSAADTQGRVHAVWSQGSSAPGSSLFYAQMDNSNVSNAVEIIKSVAGEITRQPRLWADGQDRLHLAWSGGPHGEIFYSRADADQAASPSGWLPAKQVSGSASASWPQIAQDRNGRLYILYSQPVNEGRGIYLVFSDDGGDSWSVPILVFDAAAAGWETIDHPALAVGLGGELHAAWAKPNLAASSPTQGIYYTRTRGKFSPPETINSTTPATENRPQTADPQWIQPYQVADPGSDWPQLAVTGDQLQLLFSGGGQLYQRWLAISQQTAEGSGWGNLARLSGWDDPAVSTNGTARLGQLADWSPFSLAADSTSLHLVAAVPGSTTIKYSTWSQSPDGSSGRWSQLETFSPAGSWTNLTGVAAGVPSTGGLLGIAWLALPGKDSAATPQPSLPQIYLTARQVPNVEPPGPAQSQAKPPAAATPSSEPTANPTATPQLSQQPPPEKTGLSPLVLGSGLAALIVIAIFIGILVQGKAR